MEASKTNQHGYRQNAFINLTTIQLSYLVRFMGNLAVSVLWSKKLGGPKFRKPLSLLSSWKLNIPEKIKR